MWTPLGPDCRQGDGRQQQERRTLPHARTYITIITPNHVGHRPPCEPWCDGGALNAAAISQRRRRGVGKRTCTANPLGASGPAAESLRPGCDGRASSVCRSCAKESNVVHFDAARMIGVGGGTIGHAGSDCCCVGTPARPAHRARARCWMRETSRV